MPKLVIVARSEKALRPTHDVRYTTHYEGLPSSRSVTKITAIRFRDKEPSRDLVVRKLRAQLGIEDTRVVRVVSLSPFKGYDSRA